MEACSDEGAVCPRLLNLIPQNAELLIRRDGGTRGYAYSEEKELELRLGPPGGDPAPKGAGETKETGASGFSPGYLSGSMGRGKRVSAESSTAQKLLPPENPDGGAVRLSSPWSRREKNPSVQFPTNGQSLAVTAKEYSKHCCTEVAVAKDAERKGCSSANTAVHNSSQKRTAPSSIVGWPPVRLSRKNLAGNSPSKPAVNQQNQVLKVSSEKAEESRSRGAFVKVNMEGVLIGRKVDLKAYDSYEQLFHAVDELFRDSIAGSCGGVKHQNESGITGLSCGNGEYKVVYEDDVGDRMLVGDVPWHMFVCTAKRLRVLKKL